MSARVIDNGGVNKYTRYLISQKALQARIAGFARGSCIQLPA
jgi:hypothetical protein